MGTSVVDAVPLLFVGSSTSPVRKLAVMMETELEDAMNDGQRWANDPKVAPQPESRYTSDPREARLPQA